MLAVALAVTPVPFSLFGPLYLDVIHLFIFIDERLYYKDDSAWLPQSFIGPESDTITLESFDWVFRTDLSYNLLDNFLH